MLILPAVILFCGCPVFAEGADSTKKTAPVNPWGEYSQDMILTTLEINHELWLEAQLAGHREEAAQIEKELLSLLNCDIYTNQERVKELAGELVLLSDGLSDTSHSNATDSLAQKADFREALGTLNAKEALHRSMLKTGAFSNKYRLLGDYIDLLRRELDMPRLKLASSKPPLPGESNTQSTVRPREDNP
jgi:hypothetical protein